MSTHMASSPSSPLKASVNAARQSPHVALMSAVVSCVFNACLRVKKEAQSRMLGAFIVANRPHGLARTREILLGSDPIGRLDSEAHHMWRTRTFEPFGIGNVIIR